MNNVGNKSERAGGLWDVGPPFIFFVPKSKSQNAVVDPPPHRPAIALLLRSFK